METLDITRYPFSFIESLSENFDAVLDTETINSLLQIKRDNKFVKRNNPLRLKYKLGDSWRNNNKFDNTQLSNREKYDSLVVSNLNKLTNDNYDNILKEIKETLELYNIISINVFIDLIFEKAIDEQLYSNVYAKLLADILLNLKNDDDTSIEYLKSKCNSFYEENVNNDRSLEEITVASQLDYDTLCKKFREKAKFLGGFILISNLFNYNLVSYSLVLSYYKGLTKFVENSPKETIGIYIDTIVSIITSCGKALRDHDSSQFDSNFLQIAKSLSKDKEKVIAKYRFKIFDVIDLVSNNWEQ